MVGGGEHGALGSVVVAADDDELGRAESLGAFVPTPSRLRGLLA